MFVFIFVRTKPITQEEFLLVKHFIVELDESKAFLLTMVILIVLTRKQMYNVNKQYWFELSSITLWYNQAIHQRFDYAYT